MLRKNRLFLFITDEMIYYVLRNKSNKILVCSEEALPEGVIVNADVENPLELYNILKRIMEKNKMKVGRVSFIIHEENILIRKLSVKKSELTGKSIYDHIKKQIGDTIHFPFERPVYDIHIEKETEEGYEVVIFITDEDVLQDYLDVLEKLWISNVDFDTSLVALYRLYNHKRVDCKPNASKKAILPEDSNVAVDDDLEQGKRIAIVGGQLCSEESKTDEGLMLVSLYNNNVSLLIYDGKYPVFSLIEDVDSKENYCEFVANYIDRISNYYSYNMHKGKKEIENIELFNFTTGEIYEIIQEKIQSCVERENMSFFKFDEVTYEYSKDIPSGCHIPLAAGIGK